MRMTSVPNASSRFGAGRRLWSTSGRNATGIGGDISGSQGELEQGIEQSRVRVGFRGTANERQGCGLDSNNKEKETYKQSIQLLNYNFFSIRRSSTRSCDSFVT